MRKESRPCLEQSDPSQEQHILITRDNVSQITMCFLSSLNETNNHRFTLFFLSLLCYFDGKYFCYCDHHLGQKQAWTGVYFNMYFLHIGTLWDNRFLPPNFLGSAFSCSCHHLFWMPCSGWSRWLICRQWAVYSCSHGVWQICGYMSTTGVPLCHVKVKTHYVNVLLLGNTMLRFGHKCFSNI